MIAVHVWTEDGQYLGQLFPQPGSRLGVEIQDESHRKRVTSAITSYASQGNNFIELRLGSNRQALEFPSPMWIAIASIVTLPSEGYRVHVMIDGWEIGPS